MINVYLFYAYRPDGRFDMDYYCGSHMPLAAKLFGAALKGWSVDAGVTGGQPGSAPPYFAVGHFLFDTAEAFYQAFTPVADQLLGDVPNYYDGGPPQVMISEVKVSK
ncbi:EthD family reductase [Paraburkholderia sp. SOS3]|jgi:uncharacterized protein (TIGR02118 family)|uniref:EthD family reductase n=1 Tax=Paraburkholderia sp. SOS3 TaxID=1926494 RepID=UPI0009473882|nr:EthD family reductase [Paraburkholderia sp. SOS3]APR34766.1 ethyl tert-butyl ether degradation protein EthD [Paraburkholderia sp. SOS3]